MTGREQLAARATSRVKHAQTIDVLLSTTAMLHLATASGYSVCGMNGRRRWVELAVVADSMPWSRCCATCRTIAGVKR